MIKKIWSVAICTTLVLVGALGTMAKPSSVAVSDTKEWRCLLHGWIYDEKYNKLPASNVLVLVCNVTECSEHYCRCKSTNTSETGYYRIWVDKPGQYYIFVYQEYGCYVDPDGYTVCNVRLLGKTTINISYSDDEKVVNLTWIHKYPIIRLTLNNLPQGEYAKVVWAIGEKGYIPPWLLAILCKGNRRLPLLETLIGILVEKIFYPIKVSRYFYYFPEDYPEEGTCYCCGEGLGCYTIVAMTPSSFASKEIYIEQWGQEVNVTLDLSNSPPPWYKLL